MKKYLSGLMALLLLLAVCTGCGENGENGGDDGPISSKGIYYDITGIEPQETVLEYNGNTAPAEMYFYWLGYSCSYVEYMINSYNFYYTDLINEDGTIVWDGAMDDTTPAQYAKDSTESNVLSYMVVEDLAKEYGVALTDEDKASMEENLTQQIEQAGGEEAFQQSLREIGVSQETYDRISAAGYLLDHLEAMAADPASGLYAPPADDDAYVDHILLMTVDSETREPLSEEDIAAKKALAEDLLAQLQAADDVEALFNQLVEEYGEDPGRAASSGYLVNPETNFVQEFLDAAFALKPGELSGIVESEHGYHILLRKELTEEQLATVASNHLTELLTERLEAAQDSLVRNEKLDGIDAGAFYNSYLDIMNQLHPADAPEDDASGEDGTAPDASGEDGAEPDDAADGADDAAGGAAE